VPAKGGRNQCSCTAHRREGFLRFHRSRCFARRAARASGSSLSKSAHAPIPRYATLTHLRSASSVTSSRVPADEKGNGVKRTIFSTEDESSRKLTRRFGGLRRKNYSDFCLSPSRRAGQLQALMLPEISPAAMRFAAEVAPGDRGDAAPRPACSTVITGIVQALCPRPRTSPPVRRAHRRRRGYRPSSCRRLEPVPDRRTRRPGGPSPPGPGEYRAC
jgi:hypothetical protein